MHERIKTWIMIAIAAPSMASAFAGCVGEHPYPDSKVVSALAKQGYSCTVTTSGSTGWNGKGAEAFCHYHFNGADCTETVFVKLAHATPKIDSIDHGPECHPA